MKSYKIALFMLAVIAGLALVAYIFPHEGVQLGAVHFRFVDVSDFRPDEHEVEIPVESPEELLARQLAELNRRNDSIHRVAFESLPTSLTFPADSVEIFDSFFASLDKADSVPMRIMHYGDSQIEEDRITSVLRDRLQEHFGGSGVGYVPIVQPIGATTIRQTSTSELYRYLVYANQSMRAAHDHYGIGGHVTMLDHDVDLTFYTIRDVTEYAHSEYFNRLTLMTGRVEEAIELTLNGKKHILAPNTHPLNFLPLHLSDSTRRVSLTLSGMAELHGFLLDGARGVSVDNIPMRGCSGTIFTQMDSQILSQFARRTNVGLVILQYGGNAMPYLKSAKSIQNFKRSIARQITHIKRVVPQAQILFIGPSDMSTRINGVMQTYPHLPQVVDALREAAHDSGAAYWDLYQVMGGCNSMPRWVNANPKLASTDHIHFSRLGAERVGEILSETLMMYYDYYCLRAGF